jgi:3-hydroxyacyl-[acyl-carrier-protein] dehydratase
MQFRQLDRLISLEPGKRLVAERTLRPEEDYLRDHFPNFPVMPGVMMLEALHQAAVWMVRTGDDFQSPLVMLREARSVKFGEFLGPGETLQINVELVKEDETTCTVKASAEKNGKTTVSARLILEKCSTNQPPRLGTDENVRELARKKFAELYGTALLTQ